MDVRAGAYVHVLLDVTQISDTWRKKGLGFIHCARECVILKPLWEVNNIYMKWKVNTSI